VGASGESQRGADSAGDPSLERRPALEVAAAEVHLHNGAEAEPRKAEVNWTATEVMVNAIEAVEVNESAWSSLLSVGSRVIGRATQLLVNSAARFTCGLKNFERVMASLPSAITYITQCDTFMCMQLTRKYTMSEKGMKQKLKRRAAKATKGNLALTGSPAAVEDKTFGKKTSQPPSQTVNRERASEEVKEFEGWAAEYQARHLAKLGINSSLREAKWREYGLRCVDRWPKGGAKNFKDIVASNRTPHMVIMYTDGVNLDCVDLDKVDTHPSLYRRDRERQTAQVCRRPRGHSRLKRTKTQHAVIQQKERRLKSTFTDLARVLKAKRTKELDDPGARLDRAQRTRWRRIERLVPISEEYGPALKVIKTRECRKPDVKHNRAERARWWRELKTFTSRIWQDSAHPRRTHEQEGEVLRVRLYRLRRVYNCVLFVNIVEEEVRRKDVKIVEERRKDEKIVDNSPTTEPEHSVKT
jgi:hypothetical protein